MQVPVELASPSIAPSVFLMSIWVLGVPSNTVRSGADMCDIIEIGLTIQIEILIDDVQNQSVLVDL